MRELLARAMPRADALARAFPGRVRAVKWRRVGEILWEARPVWVFLLGAITAWVAAGIGSSDVPAQATRASGILQLSGVGLVLYELAKRPGAFGTEGILMRARQWFTRLGAALNPRKLSIDGESAGVSIATGEFRAGVSIANDAPVEAQLAWLRAEVVRLTDHAEEQDRYVRREVRRLDDALAREAEVLRQDLAAIRKHLKDFATEDIPWEWVGALWVLVGIILGTWPAEAGAAVKLLF